MSTANSGLPRVLPNALGHYHAEVEHALSMVAADRERTPGFVPAFELGPLTESLRNFFTGSELGFSDLGNYAGCTLTLLDLARNLRTRTTKTFPSMVIVARAVRHVTRTGEPVMILTPSSANKATALRAAVEAAIEARLVDRRALQIVSVVPDSSRSKLWASALDEDSDLHVRNPIVVFGGPDPEGVKALARQVASNCSEELWQRYGVRLWHSLELDNYRAADVVRAFAEQDLLPEPPAAGRLHIHAVSSAFGLLGHHLGHTLRDRPGPLPRYFLVQHLHTPDMVLSLRFGSSSRANLPVYRLDANDGLYRQDADPHFPAVTYHPDENLDATFYTHRPSTSALLDELIHSRGGDGIVVSLLECLQRYGQVRELLAAAGVALPVDPRMLREWADVMVLTGLLNAIDRSLIEPGEQIVVHGSGAYADGDFAPIQDARLCTAHDPEALAELVRTAASGQVRQLVTA